MPLERPPKPNPVVAEYLALNTPDRAWVDVPEAKPRCRVRMHEGHEPELVRVHQDGTIEASERVEVDPYENYPDLRDEGGKGDG